MRGLGRAGVVHTPHGDILTPAFVPVATKATVKALTPEQVRELGAQVVLANTYHLYLQPGDALVARAGGFGKFMGWSGPTITDSGGFQAFSLGAAFGTGISKLLKKSDELILPEGQADIEERENEAEKKAARLAKIDRDGVMFRSHIDGSAHYFTPEKSIDIQHNLGADIIFAFDECTSPTEPIHYQREALDRTHAWARRSLTRHQEQKSEQALFGIVQGGRHEELRKTSAAAIGEMDFAGFGIGGSFAKEDMSQAVRWVNEILPPERPRHLLGIGEPADIFGAVENGCDLFDCVAPTRNARTGTLYTSTGKLNILNSQFMQDFSPVDAQCDCFTCRTYTRAYLAHLFRAKEMLAATLASIHNLRFIIKLTEDIRSSILHDTFEKYKESFFQVYTH